MRGHPREIWSKEPSSDETAISNQSSRVQVWGSYRPVGLGLRSICSSLATKPPEGVVILALSLVRMRINQGQLSQISNAAHISHRQRIILPSPAFVQLHVRDIETSLTFLGQLLHYHPTIYRTDNPPSQYAAGTAPLDHVLGRNGVCIRNLSRTVIEIGRIPSP